MKISTTALTLSLASISTPAFANAITADSKAFDLENNGTTLEIGASYRQFDVKKVRHEARHRTVTKHIPAVYAECGKRIITPAYDLHIQETYYVQVPFTDTISKSNANAKVSQRFGDDFLASIGYDSKLYGSASVKNGSSVLTVGSNIHGDAFGTLAVSVSRNLALVAHTQKGLTAYGAQVQLGDTSIMASYSPSVNGYSIGIGQELAAKKAPTFNLQPVKETVPVKTPLKFTLPASVDNVKNTFLDPKLPPLDQKFIRGRG